MRTKTFAVVCTCAMFIFSTSCHEAQAAFWNRSKSKTSPAQEKKSDGRSEHSEAGAAGASGNARPAGASKAVKVVTPVRMVSNPADIQQVEKELKAIIDRTRTLETQAVTDRAEVEQMLKRAQIHEQILRTMKIPEPVHTVTPVDTNRILQQEKIRLISEQAQRTQRTLALLQRTGAAPRGTAPTPFENKEE